MMMHQKPTRLHPLPGPPSIDDASPPIAGRVPTPATRVRRPARSLPTPPSTPTLATSSHVRVQDPAACAADRPRLDARRVRPTRTPARGQCAAESKESSLTPASPCPEFRKGELRKPARHVAYMAPRLFRRAALHPARYHGQPCKGRDGLPPPGFALSSLTHSRDSLGLARKSPKTRWRATDGARRQQQRSRCLVRDSPA
ncbi:uncharacterized protein A4U43_C01F20690 [Asparagus officinalis]|uniref:Uncharacterized protein n=1 Tax=Asparagus officinalis TaxID=4686 RepID=A0A5P1FRQ3_ASPOF|nr:uncharacterized protein A4U43_C01F20690 [Asparagus officinalis]